MKVGVFICLLVVGCQSMLTKNTRVEVHGHRGSRGTHPENTLVAFQEAVLTGVDYLEMDMHVTKDDVLVIYHDPEIHGGLCLDARGRPVKKPLPIRSLTYGEIQAFDCGSIRQKRFPEQKLLPNAKIPKLEDVLIWLKAEKHPQQLNIETKMEETHAKWNPAPEHFAQLVIDLLRKHRMVGRTVLQSFDYRTLDAAREMEPELRLSVLMEKAKQFCKTAKDHGATFASPEFNFVTAEEVVLCHQSGIQVVPWTLNSETDWQRALDIQVDAIISDYPRKLISYLRTATSDAQATSGN